MEISNIYNKFRSYSNPKSLSFFYPLSKTLISSTNPKISCISTHQNPNTYPGLFNLYYLLSSFRSISTSSSSPSQHFDYRYFPCLSRSFSTSSSKFSVPGEESDFDKSSRRRNCKNKVEHLNKPKIHPGQIREILEVIKSDEDDMESKLNRMGIRFSLDLIEGIFRQLSIDGVSGLRFFVWVREDQCCFRRNSEFCSLVIDNLGRIRQYELMLLLLKDFSNEKLCLTEKAFTFVTITVGSDRLDVRDCAEMIVKILKEVGGSCFSSGIHALIKRLCVSSYFDLARFVMEATERKTSYYNVFIWAKCGSVSCQEARLLFDEMRRFGCEPDGNSYDYLLGSFCKNGNVADACSLLEIMDEFGFSLDATKFEIFINRACTLGRLDFAIEFLNHMASSGIEPRLTTHATVIKGYYYSNRFQEAYKYVVDMADKYKCSANLNYGLLATLLQRSRRVVEAREILVVMMEKGLKPNFPVYMKVLKDLYGLGMGDLVADLKSRFSKFH